MKGQTMMGVKKIHMECIQNCGEEDCNCWDVSSTERLDIGTSSATFEQLARCLVYMIARALDGLGQTPDRATIQHYVTNIDELYIKYSLKTLAIERPNAVEMVEVLESKMTNTTTPKHLQGRSQRVVALETYFMKHPPVDSVLVSLRGVIQYDKGELDKVVACLLPLLEER